MGWGGRVIEKKNLNSDKVRPSQMKYKGWKREGESKESKNRTRVSSFRKKHWVAKSENHTPPHV